MFDQIPPEVRGAVPGVAGSLLALMFMRRAAFTAVGIFVGGCILSYYATPWVAEAMQTENANGLVGFLIGLFGMALVAKVYDTLEAVSPTELWTAIRQFIRKRLGLEP